MALGYAPEVCRKFGRKLQKLSLPVFIMCIQNWFIYLPPAILKEIYRWPLWHELTSWNKVYWILQNMEHIFCSKQACYSEEIDEVVELAWKALVWEIKGQTYSPTGQRKSGLISLPNTTYTSILWLVIPRNVGIYSHLPSIWELRRGGDEGKEGDFFYAKETGRFRWSRKKKYFCQVGILYFYFSLYYIV